MSTPHAEVLAAALRHDTDQVRAGIAHLDQPATEQLRHACVRVAEACMDHEDRLAWDRRHQAKETAA